MDGLHLDLPFEIHVKGGVVSEREGVRERSWWGRDVGNLFVTRSFGLGSKCILVFNTWEVPSAAEKRKTLSGAAGSEWGNFTVAALPRIEGSGQNQSKDPRESARSTKPH